MAKKHYSLAALRVGGIKCDNETCDYHDDSVVFDDYKSYLGRPCPDCGSNLLTIEDFAATLKAMNNVMKIESFLNRWLPEFVLRRMAKGEVHTHHIDRVENGKLRMGKRIS